MFKAFLKSPTNLPIPGVTPHKTGKGKEEEEELDESAMEACTLLIAVLKQKMKAYSTNDALLATAGGDECDERWFHVIPVCPH